MFFAHKQYFIAFQSIFTATNCDNYWDLMQKITLQWYLISYSLAKFSLNSQVPCIKGDAVI